jgi:hypothetical protein
VVKSAGANLRAHLLTFLRTELSPSWEAANCAAIQEIPRNFKSKLHTKILIKIYLSLWLNKRIVRMTGEVDVQSHAFVTSNVWRGMISFTLRPLHSEKKPQVLTVYEVVWTSESVWTLS